jgi:ATP-dependent DNA helicase RecQ
VKKDLLVHLGIAPDDIACISGNDRSRLLNFLLRWQQYETALACLEILIPLHPELVSLYDAKARALLGLGRADAALEVMQVRHETQASIPSRRLEAQIHLALGDTDAALAIADDLVLERPKRTITWALLGEVHLTRNDLDAAQGAYRNIAELRPYSRAYYLGMLMLHQARGDFVTASGYAVRLQRAATDDASLPVPTLFHLRDYFRASGEINRAEGVSTELAALYDVELSELQAALADVPEIMTPTSVRSTPAEKAELPATTPELGADALSLSDAISVPIEERQRLENAVRTHFGHLDLLPGQAETLAAALCNQDVLTVLPTGGGKSLCYQLPALLDTAGTTVVISPLIALMKDQVDSLPDQIRHHATTINSSLEGKELHRRMRNVAAGRYRLVYVAPERLRQPPFLHALRRAGINRLVIDEAHCISVWGHDFRPDYLYIAQARQALGSPPVLAMTATAPPRVRRDILQRLEGPESVRIKQTTGGSASGGKTGTQDNMAVVATDVYRHNLFLTAVRARNADEKLRYLLALAQAENGSGIIYAGTRERCERIAALLQRQGISAGFYHAGIGDRVARATAQDAFMSGQIRIMVATVAFGMGIDKADIRFIIHMQLPASLETYYQEAGRAGRDGLPSRCVLIHSAADRAVLTRRAKRDAPQIEFLRSVYAAIRARLGDATLGRVATGDLMRDVRAEDTAVRVAICMLEEAGLLRRHQDAPRTVVVRLRDGDSGQSTVERDAAWTHFLSAARLRPGQPLPIDLIAVAQKAKLDPTRIESSLLAWADAGWLEYRPTGRELLLELPPYPADASARVQELIDRHATIQVQRVDEIAAYAATTHCRHGHISAYLSGQAMEKCESCDNCRPEASPFKRAISAINLPDEGEQLQTVLRCVASSPGGWGQANLTYILCASSRASQRGQQSPELGALSFRSRTAVEKMVDRLIADGLLRARQLAHGGTTLVLTPAGHAALADATRLGSLASQPNLRLADASEHAKDKGPQTGTKEEALFERLREWRHETAQRASVPAFVVAHDALLRRIAAARPQNEAELAQIKGIGPKRLAQYGAPILALVKGGGPDAENDIEIY